ncbi:hypothetical protein [Crinalium epipsammum]|uniref:hypothetical protein n=1 Tax=Crinalium epipsammum TaxID=241425 RepID=UPI0002EC142E|nr:hypothetical protein [Crinalium epipsammum]
MTELLYNPHSALHLVLFFVVYDTWATWRSHRSKNLNFSFLCNRQIAQNIGF